MAIPISVPCPICGVKVAFDAPNMPFCSDRCRDRDLGNWATEKYVIGSNGSDELESELEGELATREFGESRPEGSE